MSSAKENSLESLKVDPVEEQFHQYFALPEDRRAKFLEALYHHNPSLAEEVESLVRAHESHEDGMLDRPPVSLSKLTDTEMTSGTNADTQTFYPDLKTNPVIVGNYQLLARLGRGATAEVFQACHKNPKEDARHFAIKCILPQYSENEDCITQFAYEAKLSNQLSHPNIARTIDFLCVNNNYFLVMEYVEGKNLQYLIQEAVQQGVKIPYAYSAYIVNEICKGLDYAHSRTDSRTGQSLNVIHRDISPKNVMISKDGKVKIIDFGIAKAANKLQQTRIGVLKGTVSYMSPEQASGDAVDQRSDIFSSTAVLFELIAGERLFSADNTIATLDKVRHGEISDTMIQSIEAPESLKGIVKKGLQRLPQDRFESAAELQKALQRCLNEIKPAISPRDIAQFFAKLGHFSVEDVPSPPTEMGYITVGSFARVVIPAVLTLIVGILIYQFWPTAPEPKRTVASTPAATASFTPQIANCMLRLSSKPSAASAYVDGKYVGVAPTRIDIPCGKTMAVSFKRKGYEPFESTIKIKKGSKRLFATLTPSPKRTPASRKSTKKRPSKLAK